MSSRYDGALADLRQQRQKIDSAILLLEELNGSPTVAVAPFVASPAPASRPGPRRKAPSTARAPRAAAVLGGLDPQSQKIVDALVKASASQSVSQLEASTGLSRYLLNDRLTQLSAKRRVTITGETSDKRIALKEVP